MAYVTKERLDQKKEREQLSAVRSLGYVTCFLRSSFGFAVLQREREEQRRIEEVLEVERRRKIEEEAAREVVLAWCGLESLP
jgi:hypothetical protein